MAYNVIFPYTVNNTQTYSITLTTGGKYVPQDFNITVNTEEVLTNLTSNATATGSDILSGKSAYVNGMLVNGNIPTLTPNTTYFQTSTTGAIAESSLGAGYLSTKYYIKAGSATTPTNSTAINSTSTSLSGTILTVQASVTPTVSAGWVASGTAGTVKISGTVPTETKSVTVSTSGNSTITPTAGKLLSSVSLSVPAAQNVTPTATVTSQESLGASSSGTITKKYFRVTPSVTVGTAGWISSGSTGSAFNYEIQTGTAAPNATVSGSSSTLTNTTQINYQYLTVTPTASVSTPGWISSISNASAKNFKIKDGTCHNGYVTTGGSGWFSESSQIYTLSYDSNTESVDFVWNN